MRTHSLVLVLLCIAAVSGQQAPPTQTAPRPAPVGQTPAADRAPAQPSATLASIYTASAPAKLTADPNSAFWKDIKGVWIERRIDTSEPAPQLRTEVRSRWTPGYIHFLAVCPYEQLNLRPNPQTVSDTNRLWEHDVLEIYIGSNFDDITKYLELQVSPQGEHLDGTIDATLPRVGVGNEWVWESGWKTHARLDREKQIWYAEVQLPIASFDKRPVKAGNEFRLNLYRLQGPHPPAPARRDFVAWLPTGEYHPHRPLKFGRLKLVEKP